MEEIEEGPEKGDNEAGDDNKEEPLIVTTTKEILSRKLDSCGRSSTGHADHSEYLVTIFLIDKVAQESASS